MTKLAAQFQETKGFLQREGGELNLEEITQYAVNDSPKQSLQARRCTLRAQPKLCSHSLFEFQPDFPIVIHVHDDMPALR